MNKDQLPEEILKRAQYIISAENGRKGAKRRWAKYPPGSIERIDQLAPMREGFKKKKLSTDDTIDSQ